MATSVFLSEDPSYIALLDYYEQHGKKLRMQQMFKEDQGRFTKFRFALLNCFVLSRLPYSLDVTCLTF